MAKRLIIEIQKKQKIICSILYFQTNGAEDVSVGERETKREPEKQLT